MYQTLKINVFFYQNNFYFTFVKVLQKTSIVRMSFTYEGTALTTTRDGEEQSVPWGECQGSPHTAPQTVWALEGLSWRESFPRCSNDFPQIGTNVASSADKDGVIDCAKQVQLTNIRASEAPSRRRGASLASIFVSWICKAQMITGLCQLVMRRLDRFPTASAEFRRSSAEAGLGTP